MSDQGLFMYLPCAGQGQEAESEGRRGRKATSIQVEAGEGKINLDGGVYVALKGAMKSTHRNTQTAVHSPFDYAKSINQPCLEQVLLASFS